MRVPPMRVPMMIETARLDIRPFEEQDEKDFVEFMTNPNSTKYLHVSDAQKTPQGAKELFNFIVSSYQTDAPIFTMAIEDRESEQYIGSIGFSPYGGEGEYECHYSINEPHLKKGYAKEALDALLQYGFFKGATKIYAFSHPENEAGQKVAQGVGMKLMGEVERKDLPYPAKCFVIEKGAKSA